MVDIDFFKKINDAHGHSTGDLVLQALSGLFERELREVDIVGRLGGEEFAIVLPQTDGTNAIEVAERLRQGVADTGIVRPQGLPIHFTISIGVAVLQASTVTVLQGATNIEILLSQADKALYAAKRTGRNRVIASWQMPL
jgi:diguanylate cyclase (GGDEF)-like protein